MPQYLYRLRLAERPHDAQAWGPSDTAGVGAALRGDPWWAAKTAKALSLIH